MIFEDGLRLEMFDVRTAGILAVHAPLSGSRHAGQDLSNSLHRGALPLRPPRRLDIGTCIDESLHAIKVIPEGLLEGRPGKAAHGRSGLFVRFDVALEEVQLFVLLRSQANRLLLRIETGIILSG